MSSLFVMFVVCISLFAGYEYGYHQCKHHLYDLTEEVIYLDVPAGYFAADIAEDYNV